MLESGWIEVKERMPKPLTQVLVFGRCCEACKNIRIVEFDDVWYDAYSGENIHFKPEFWQPLPYPF